MLLTRIMFYQIISLFFEMMSSQLTSKQAVHITLVYSMFQYVCTCTGSPATPFKDVQTYVRLITIIQLLLIKEMELRLKAYSIY